MKRLEWRDEAPRDVRYEDEKGVERRSGRLTRVATPPTPQPEEVEVEEQVEDVSSDEDVQDGALRCVATIDVRVRAGRMVNGSARDTYGALRVHGVEERFADSSHGNSSFQVMKKDVESRAVARKRAGKPCRSWE